MREEIERFLKQAAADLDAAERILGTGAYHVVAFLCQQSVEKFLEALHMAVKRQSPPKTHELPSLAKAFDPPPEIFEHLADLNPDFVVSRYPDAANGIPAELYTESKARDKLRRAREVVAWVRGLLPK